MLQKPMGKTSKNDACYSA